VPVGVHVRTERRLHQRYDLHLDLVYDHNNGAHNDLVLDQHVHLDEFIDDLDDCVPPGALRHNLL
jgi:hypothetical protein